MGFLKKLFGKKPKGEKAEKERSKDSGDDSFVFEASSGVHRGNGVNGTRTPDSDSISPSTARRTRSASNGMRQNSNERSPQSETASVRRTRHEESMRREVYDNDLDELEHRSVRNARSGRIDSYHDGGRFGREPRYYDDSPPRSRRDDERYDSPRTYRRDERYDSPKIRHDDRYDSPRMSEERRKRRSEAEAHRRAHKDGTCGCDCHGHLRRPPDRDERRYRSPDVRQPQDYEIRPRRTSSSESSSLRKEAMTRNREVREIERERRPGSLRRGDDDRYRADDRYRRDEYDSPRRRRPSDVPVRRFSSGDYTSTVYRDRDDRR